MTETTGDRWAGGDAYEGYMGRWSRLVAAEFVEWLSPQPGAHWLEIGCGTGALTSTVCRLATPASIVACDQSAPFVTHARGLVEHPGASFAVASLDSLPSRDGGFDCIISGLVLNFIAEPDVALSAMRTRARPGALIAAYIWDYRGGLEFLHHFWQVAVALDPNAAPLDESIRFAAWTGPKLISYFEAAGLSEIEDTVLSIPTHFANFEELWTPFLGGTGPAPSYVASLAPTQRDALAKGLKSRLPPAPDGPIRLEAQALAVRGRHS